MVISADSPFAGGLAVDGLPPSLRRRERRERREKHVPAEHIMSASNYIPGHSVALTVPGHHAHDTRPSSLCDAGASTTCPHPARPSESTGLARAQRNSSSPLVGPYTFVPLSRHISRVRAIIRGHCHNTSLSDRHAWNSIQCCQRWYKLPCQFIVIHANRRPSPYPLAGHHQLAQCVHK